MEFFTHKSRHVVVSTTPEADGKRSVTWVDFANGVEGRHRRGRRPSYDQPISASELTPADSTDALVEKATRLLSPAAGSDTTN